MSKPIPCLGPPHVAVSNVVPLSNAGNPTALLGMVSTSLNYMHLHTHDLKLVRVFGGASHEKTEMLSKPSERANALVNNFKVKQGVSQRSFAEHARYGPAAVGS